MSVSKGANTLALLALVVAVSACGLPRSGPSKAEIYRGSVLRGGDAFIVSVNPRVTRATSVMPSYQFGPGFEKAGLIGSDVIAAGDVLSLTVYENVTDEPLLGASGQRQSQLNELQVDGQGFIFIPYAGRIQAAGKSPEELRQIIAAKLDTQTPDPQVIVGRVPGDGSTVTLTGAVGSQGVRPIERPTRTLSAMIASAGGVSIDPETAIIRVTRGNQTGKVWLVDLYENPALDIALRPGDLITVDEDRRSFVTMGATGSQTRVDFETQTLSAIEALALVGGLNTGLADPTGVFVFRNEPAEIANAVLGRTDLVGAQRVVYVLDLTRPNGMFEARDFLVRDGDTVYVTEAPYVQWQKTLSAITGTAGAASTLGGAAQ
jgi:polysaccharide export outer membrane protein